METHQMKRIDIVHKSWGYTFSGNERIRLRFHYDINTTNMSIQFHTLTHISNSIYAVHFSMCNVGNLK